MRRRGNLRIAAVAHDLANTVNVDAAFLASVAEVQRGLGKGESLFEQTMKACRDGDVAALSGCAAGLTCLAMPGPCLDFRCAALASMMPWRPWCAAP